MTTSRKWSSTSATRTDRSPFPRPWSVVQAGGRAGGARAPTWAGARASAVVRAGGERTVAGNVGGFRDPSAEVLAEAADAFGLLASAARLHIMWALSEHLLNTSRAPVSGPSLWSPAGGWSLLTDGHCSGVGPTRSRPHVRGGRREDADSGPKPGPLAPPMIKVVEAFDHEQGSRWGVLQRRREDVGLSCPSAELPDVISVSTVLVRLNLGSGHRVSCDERQRT